MEVCARCQEENDGRYARSRAAGVRLIVNVREACWLRSFGHLQSQESTHRTPLDALRMTPRAKRACRPACRTGRYNRARSEGGGALADRVKLTGMAKAAG